MSLGRAGEDYLEAILLLGRRKPCVRAVDVAEELGVSRPSVCVALRGLKDKGCVTSDEDNFLHLTEQGRAVAETVNERRQLFQALFVQLGIDPARAAADACNMEHAISSESFAALKQYLRRTGMSV